MYALLLLGFDCVRVLRFVFIVSLGVFDFVLMTWVVLWVIVAPVVLLVLVVFVLVHFDCCLTRWCWCGGFVGCACGAWCWAVNVGCGYG